jgi:hypothetical protein
MGKTTKLNPVRQTDGVKNHVTHSLSKHKIFNLTAMPVTGSHRVKDCGELPFHRVTSSSPDE